MSTTAKKDQMNQAGDKASQAVDKAREAAGHVGEAAQQAAAGVGQQIDHAAGSVGSTVRQAADTVRDYGPNSGMLGSATESVAGAIEGAGKYLEGKQLSGMADDVAGLIKRNPIPAVLIGVGVGFLIGRALASVGTSSTSSFTRS